MEVNGMRELFISFQVRNANVMYNKMEHPPKVGKSQNDEISSFSETIYLLNTLACALLRRLTYFSVFGFSIFIERKFG